MTIIISLVYLLLLFGVSLAVGLSGSSSIIESIMQEPLLGLDILILLFGLFSTIMWHRKSKKQKDYKIWFYLSVGSILLFLLIYILPNWQIFLRGLS
ncbi:hypothetical protein HYW72_00020 [Candidatus Nomurabacteria bacterium]|nr:hypothetical protein [Candidatus Nomurabacteria bacterium]